MLVLVPLAISALSYGLSVLLQKSPKDANNAPAAFTIPDAVQGQAIPYLAGTYDIVPNIVWYGGYNVHTWTTGHKASKQTQQEAFLSHLDILCLGPIDEILYIMADDAVIYQGPLTRGSGAVTTINTTLGQVQIGWGTPDQAVNASLVNAGWPAASALRNVAYLFFNQCKLNGSFNVQRLVIGVNRVPVTPLVEAAAIARGVNPAHFFYDMLTNRFAGGRFAPEDLDLDAFNAMATTFAAEGLGVNVLLQGTSMKDVVNNFMVEMDAIIRVRGGVLSPKLLRDDYDPTTLPLIDETNSATPKRRREPYGPAPNDGLFRYMSVDLNYRSETIELFNTGSITTLLRRQVQDTTLALVTDVGAASLVAARKMRELNAPADSITLDLNPGIAGPLELGDPVKITNSRLGIAGMICRVLDLTEKFGDTVTISATEDVFRSEDSRFTGSIGTVATTGGLHKLVHQELVELPYMIVGPAVMVALVFGRACQIQTGVLVSLSSDDVSFAQALDTVGIGIAGVLVADYPLTPAVDLTVGITFDADSSDINLVASLSDADFLRHQQMALVDGEIIAIKALVPIAGGTTAGGRWCIQGVIRGLADTDAAVHAAGTVIYFLTTSSIEFMDPSSFAGVGGSVYAKAQPYTSSQVMALSAVDAAGPLTITGRALAPLPADNLRANPGLRINEYASGGNVVFSWTYRVKDGSGSAAGEQLAGTAIGNTAPAHEGVFVLAIWDASRTTLHRTIVINDDTGTTTYSHAQIVADFGGEPGQILAELTNTNGVYASRTRSVLVTLV